MGGEGVGALSMSASIFATLDRGVSSMVTGEPVARIGDEPSIGLMRCCESQSSDETMWSETRWNPRKTPRF